MRTPALFALAMATAALGCGSAPDDPVPIAPVPGRTVVVPHRGVAFDPAKENAVWCATFEMAWQAFGREVVKEPLRLGPPAPAAFVEGMNEHPYPMDAVDTASCIAVAGRKADGILERIANEGMEKFHRDLPQMKVALDRPDDILAYAFLRKDLPFEHPFEPSRRGIAFAGAAGRIPAWGINPGERKGADDLAAQVRLLHRTPAREPDAFVLEFTPKGEEDRILLALVPGSPSLADTWSGVARMIGEGPARGLDSNPVLQVPRIRIDLLREYRELLGAPVLNVGFWDYRLAAAAQSILFHLDEAGAMLESEALIRLTAGLPPDRPDVFVFDRPFLVALIRKDAKEPYFLAWIANADLLAK